jgi:hypothetical protein
VLEDMSRIAAWTVFVALAPAAVLAQTTYTLETEFVFYGDNTEFSNPFREGETLLGTFGRIFVDVALNDRVTFRGGVFGNQQFGSDSAFELVRPVFALRVGTPRSRFGFGTLDTVRRRDGSGPDRTSPHGLAPPLQRETLAFTRPYEAGLQWLVDTAAVRQDLWINWQKLNRTAREVFDAGIVNRFAISGPFSAGLQWHHVHHGGQQVAIGPVSDSTAGGPGLIVEPRLGWLDAASAEVYGFYARHVPDRGRPDRTTDGLGLFTRLSGERAGWRGHLIVWRSDDFIKEEGDPNYLGLRLNGSRFRKVRDYAEIGATKTFRPADGVVLEGSARFHRIEEHYEYSYRILGTVEFSIPLGR